ncbi:hypothetical protein KEM48_013366 [Puccinia striiformis f. sp. tritici PST-130]|nr:hypothetical protein KEM48_013366 [Puccinia striiformis f. sp. tritici PST-130]
MAIKPLNSENLIKLQKQFQTPSSPLLEPRKRQHSIIDRNQVLKARAETRLIKRIKNKTYLMNLNLNLTLDLNRLRN